MASQLLAVDVGNTNTVFAMFDGDRLLVSWRLATSVDRTADEYAATLSQLMELDGRSPDTVGAVVISTVVPASLFEL
ncbi:MAG: type III pantothenate kinase, partial [Rhodospirillales bacterium]|nr:type III pantothenate kinase [Rhodospirillales bacterium]